MKYNIVLAQEKDLKKINNLYSKRLNWFNENNIKQWGENYPNKYNIEYLKEQMVINKLFVIKNNNKIVGSMLLKNDDPKFWDDNEKAYYIHHLVTDINTHGIGIKLIDFAKEECIKNNKTYLRLDCVSKNEWLNEYYKNLGFEYYGKKELTKGCENLWQLKIKK